MLSAASRNLGITKGIIILVAGLFAPEAFCFVLVAGPSEARLDATDIAPTITFNWSEEFPEITDLDEFADGQYSDLGTPELGEAMIRFAMDRWNEVPGSFLQLELANDPNASTDNEDQVHTITTAKQKNQAAAAHAIPVVEGELIIDCDIVLGDSSTSAKSMAYTLIHELGHCIGLGHYHTNYGAIMGYSRGSRQPTLGADDMAGLIYLYPDPNYDATDPKELLSCSTIGPRMKNNGTWFSIWLCLMVPVLAGLGVLQRRTADMVLGARLELARAKGPRDFKSLVSTDSTTRASR